MIATLISLGRTIGAITGLKKGIIEPRQRRGKLRALHSGARVRPKLGAQKGARRGRRWAATAL